MIVIKTPKKLSLLTFFCFLSFNILAQIDTVFWFAAPEVTNSHGDRPVFLHFSTFEKPANIVVDFPSNTLLSPYYISIKSNETASIQLDSILSIIENDIPNVVSNKGLRIVSDESITAYYEVVGGNFNTDIFSLKGQNGLGLEFYTPFQNNSYRVDDRYKILPYTSFDIVATEDNTEITIVPKGIIAGNPTNDIINIVLNKGQTYSVRNDQSSNITSLSGSYIKSSKPIAVTIKDDSVKKGTGWDLIGDQLIPIKNIGDQYIINKGYVYIVATKANTRIFSEVIDLDTILQSGETLAILNQEDEIYLIEGSEPFYVLHVRFTNNEVGGAILPPLFCTGSQKVNIINSSTNIYAFNIVLIVRAGIEDKFIFNTSDVFIEPSDFEQVPGTNGKWLIAEMRLQAGSLNENIPLTIENTDGVFQMAFISGNSSRGTRYGYFSSFNGYELGQDFSVCSGEKPSINAGFGKDKYEWNTGDTMQIITIDSSGEYIVTVSEGNDDKCVYTDTIHVKLLTSPEFEINEKNFSLCEGDSVLIEPIYNGDYIFVWNGKIVDSSSYYVGRESIYLVSALIQYDEKICEITDTIRVQNTKLPILNISTSDTIVCFNETVTVELPINQNHYYLNGDSVSNYFILEQAGNYIISAKTFSEDKLCGELYDSVLIENWDIKTYNFISPNNNDGKNDLFIIEGLSKGEWQLLVYNRWGKEVYRNDEYDNSWNGNDLTPGIYFYTITEKNSSCNQVNDWLQVIR